MISNKNGIRTKTAIKNTANGFNFGSLKHMFEQSLKKVYWGLAKLTAPSFNRSFHIAILISSLT